MCWMDVLDVLEKWVPRRQKGYEPPLGEFFNFNFLGRRSFRMPRPPRLSSRLAGLREKLAHHARHAATRVATRRLRRRYKMG